MYDLNSPVTCPNCGSSDCNEYRPNCFVCRYCDSTFRWVNPHEFTIQHHPAHCSCGKNGVGTCTNCNASTCEDHFTNWQAFLGCWQKLKECYWGDNPNLKQPARQQGGMANCRVIREPGWLVGSYLAKELNEVATGRSYGWPIASEIVEAVLKRFDLSGCKDSDILCTACVESLFIKLLRPIEAGIQQMVRQDRLCRVCTIERSDAEILLLPMAHPATRRCHQCGIPVCGAHFTNCTKCRNSFCHEHMETREPPVCIECRPVGLLRSMFQFGKC